MVHPQKRGMVRPDLEISISQEQIRDILGIVGAMLGGIAIANNRILRSD